MNDPRKPIFAAVNAAKPGVWNEAGNIVAMDSLLDSLGVPRATARRIINDAGRTIIKDSEGLRLTGYLCPAGIPTVGYGHTGRDVRVGMTITQASADALLAADIADFEAGVTKLVGSHATDNQFSALVSFAFNLGLESLRTSTLLRKHNAGDYAGAKAEFGKWVKARSGGKLVTMPGLVKRRAKEAALYGAA